MDGRFLLHSPQLWLLHLFYPVSLFVVAVQAQVRLIPKIMDNFIVRLKKIIKRTEEKLCLRPELGRVRTRNDAQRCIRVLQLHPVPGAFPSLSEPQKHHKGVSFPSQSLQGELGCEEISQPSREGF